MKSLSMAWHKFIRTYLDADLVSLRSNVGSLRLICPTHASTALSLSTLAAREDTKVGSCRSAGLSTMVSRLLLSMRRLSTSACESAKSRWWEDDAGSWLMVTGDWKERYFYNLDNLEVVFHLVTWLVSFWQNRMDLTGLIVLVKLSLEVWEPVQQHKRWG